MHTALPIRAMLLAGALPLAMTAQQPAPEAFVTRELGLDVALDFPGQRLTGTATLALENWTAAPASRVSLLLNRLMDATSVTDGAGRPLRFAQDVIRLEDQTLRQVTRIQVELPAATPPGGRTVVRVAYGGHLVGYTEVGWLYVRDRIDTTFTILRADALAFPDVGGANNTANRRAPRDDFRYVAAIRVPATHVVATGGSASVTRHDDGTATWRYVSEGTSPFLNAAIARFDTLAREGLRVFHFPEDSAGARRILANALTARTVLAQWFGPQRGRTTLTIIEIPDGYGSQAHHVGGIIQTAAAFRDTTRVGELYHELTHLWNVEDIDVPSPRWNEGLASFLEGLLQERINGWPGRADYETRYLAWMKRRVAGDTILARIPFAEYGRRSLTDYSYSVGFLMFATLHELLGDAAFHRVLGGFYQRAPAGGTRDLVEFARQTAGRDLGSFFDDWLYTTRWTEVVAGSPTVAGMAARYRRGNAR